MRALVIANAVHTTHQLHHVATALAAGKAIPEIFGEVHDEGMRIVPAVYRTRPYESLAAAFERCAQALGAQHRLDGDGAFEIGKAQNGRGHCAPSRPCARPAPAVSVN